MENELTNSPDRPRIQPAWTTADRILRVAGLTGAAALIAMMVTVPSMRFQLTITFGRGLAPRDSRGA